MYSPSKKYNTRIYKRRQRAAMNNDIIVIDSSDSDDDGAPKNKEEEDLDQKPAAKKIRSCRAREEAEEERSLYFAIGVGQFG
mmetsp:Transcript_29910/g.63434  ORF Transcript_29910/g.63434 Transcript_29910/m.63434 type:complete len:82 (+) Transcript_29910:83-328(+)